MCLCVGVCVVVCVLCVSAVCVSVVCVSVCVSAVCVCCVCVLVQNLRAPTDPAPLRRTAQNVALFFPSPTPIFILFFLSLGIFSCLFFSLRVSSRVFFPLSGVFSWNFGGVLVGRDLNVLVFAFRFLCGSPQRPAGRRGFTGEFRTSPSAESASRGLRVGEAAHFSPPSSRRRRARRNVHPWELSSGGEPLARCSAIAPRLTGFESVGVGRIHFHPKTFSSNDTFIQKRFHPLTLSSKTLSSNFDTFIQTQFHPMNIHPRTFSSKKSHVGQSI